MRQVPDPATDRHPDSPVTDPDPGLDEDSRRLLQEILPQFAPHPGMSAEAMRAQARALAQCVQGDPPPVDHVGDVAIAGPGGELALRVYHPDLRATPPCLVWLHGGGFTTGGLDQHDTLCRRLCVQSAMVVVSVDYRLAPEHRFPAAVMDSFAALRWAGENARLLGAAPGRLAIGGSSAGGNLAAAVCLHSRQEGGPCITHQLLVYPVLDATMGSPTYWECGAGYQLTAAMMADYLERYVPENHDRRDPLLSPLFARLDGLPPAHVITARFDPLRGECEAFAQRLAEAGVAVELTRIDGVMHGFFGQPGVIAKAREAQKAACASLNQAFACHPPAIPPA